MKNKIILITILILVLFQLPKPITAQIADSCINIWQFDAHYAFQIPGRDLAEKYGINSMIGAGVTYKTKFNLMIGGEMSYMFGNIIKRDSTILNGLRTSNGEIINEYGEYAKIICSERGFYAGLKLGYLVTLGKPNKNSGILLQFGTGLLQHHIRIENKDNNTPQVLGDYKKGYDRLTNGLSNKYFIGYQHLNNNKKFDFYCGFEFYQAWTKNRRDFNFDTMSKDDKLYHEYLYSIKAGWILPIYTRSPEKFYYY